MSFTTDFPDWLADALDALKSGDVDGWMEIYAPDAVHEFPFAPEGGVGRLDGRDEIRGYMSGVVNAGLLRFGPYSDVRVRDAGDETIVEANGNHERTSDDAPLLLSYVWFITRRDGLVTHFRDYMNPLQLAKR